MYLKVLHILHGKRFCQPELMGFLIKVEASEQERLFSKVAKTFSYLYLPSYKYILSKYAQTLIYLPKTKC